MENITIMDVFVRLLEALVFALLGYIAWHQQEKTKDSDAKRKVLESQIEATKAERDAKIQAQRDIHAQEMTELRNDWEREKAQNEQHRSLSHILQLTIEKNSETQSDVAQAIRDGSTVQRSVEQTMIALRDNFETVMIAFGNVSETSKRAESASLQTLKTVTEKTEHIQQEITELKRELIDIRETQDSHITSAGTRHTENNIKFARITETLGTMESELAGIRALLQPSPPTPPANEIPLKQPNTETGNIDKAS